MLFCTYFASAFFFFVSGNINIFCCLLRWSNISVSLLIMIHSDIQFEVDPTIYYWVHRKQNKNVNTFVYSGNGFQRVTLSEWMATIELERNTWNRLYCANTFEFFIWFAWQTMTLSLLNLDCTLRLGEDAFATLRSKRSGSNTFFNTCILFLFLFTRRHFLSRLHSFHFRCVFFAFFSRSKCNSTLIEAISRKFVQIHRKKRAKLS